MSEKINQLIAEKVLGYTCVWFSFVNHELEEGNNGEMPFLRVLDETTDNLEYYDLPDYWNDMESAFEVMQKMNLTLTPSYDGWSAFSSNTSGSTQDISWIGTTNNQEWVKSKSATEAICLAAFKILKIDINEKIQM